VPTKCAFSITACSHKHKCPDFQEIDLPTAVETRDLLCLMLTSRLSEVQAELKE